MSPLTGHVTNHSKPKTKSEMAQVPAGGNWRNVERYANTTNHHSCIFHRPFLEDPFITLIHPCKNLLLHPTENRILTIRECARIQSYPDTYEFIGSLDSRQQMLANSVPCLFAKSIAESILPLTFAGECDTVSVEVEDG